MEQRKKKGEDGLISNFVSLNTPGTHISVVKPWLSAFCNLLFKNISKLRRLEAEKLVHAFISYCKDLCWVTHINQYKRLLLIYKTVTIHLMSCIRPLKINEQGCIMMVCCLHWLGGFYQHNQHFWGGFSWMYLSFFCVFCYCCTHSCADLWSATIALTVSICSPICSPTY